MKAVSQALFRTRSLFGLHMEILQVALLGIVKLNEIEGLDV